MRYLIAWIRTNPVTVASIAVVIVSLGFFAFLLTQRNSFRDELGQRTGQVSQIDRFISADVEIPPERPDAASDRIQNVTITSGALEQLESLYERMNEEYRQVLDYVTDFNRGDRRLFMDGILPSPSQTQRIDAREAYQQALQQLLARPSPEAVGPRLNAGGPPPVAELQEQLRAFDRDFEESRGGRLTAEEQEEMERERGLVLRQLLQRRAQELGIYAATDRRSSEYPFRVPEWTLSGTPEPRQIWEGQLELWIIQDILDAIVDANGIDDGGNLLDGPVKRLIRLEVLPGYVGLHTRGGVVSDDRGGRTAGGRGGRTTARRGATTYTEPFGGQTGSPNERVSDNFHVGPTGRVSNALYDVRHARLQVVVSSQRLPELFRSLARTNFMTVLDVKLENVDEYDALRDGFVYGADSVVEANILIETIWLREWTEDLMPEIVRQYVGIDPAGPELRAQDPRHGPEYDAYDAYDDYYPY